MISLCNERCKKKQCRKQALEYIQYIQYICVHSCTFEALAFIDIESLGLQLSTKFHGKKKTRRFKIRVTTFWACFRQDLDLNVQSPSFSAVFPPFSAVFCPLNFQFFHVFPGLPLKVLKDNNFCRIHFRCLLETCCKCQKATNNSSETAFCGQ